MHKILVIEDEAAIRNNLARFLRAEGYEVMTAENGVAGVAAARDGLPRLIICDIRMPELDGYGVLAALRQDATTARIPFMFLTASADRAERHIGLAQGADEYLTKPFKLPELLAAIKRRLAAAGDE
jgi:DNA-binding response OmpR family regulator